jgi:hypothetical protein
MGGYACRRCSFTGLKARLGELLRELDNEEVSCGQSLGSVSLRVPSLVTDSVSSGRPLSAVRRRFGDCHLPFSISPSNSSDRSRLCLPVEGGGLIGVYVSEVRFSSLHVKFLGRTFLLQESIKSSNELIGVFEVVMRLNTIERWGCGVYKVTREAPEGTPSIGAVT